MKTIAIYNMKGGVGKTTAAVNLAYLAAAGGQRTLLWDLDPQAASSFAFRIRPRIRGFGRKSLEHGRGLGDAIKETDYQNLDVLPADFACRKFERLLDGLGRPGRVMTSLLETLGAEYDVVFLDCPAGFSRVTEGLFEAVDAVLVPTIPTALSLRMVSRLIKYANRRDAPSDLMAFFSMVDRRRALHRRSSVWASTHADVFLTAQIPYANVVEQMAVRRMPLPAFAARDAATCAFADVWAELQTRLSRPRSQAPSRRRSTANHRAIEALILRLESSETGDPAPPSPERDVSEVLHTFDTGHRGLQRHG